MPELPLTRAKGKAKALVIEDHATTKSTTKPVAATPKEKDEKAAPKKPVMVVTKGPAQPDYKLRRDVLFTDLDRIVFGKHN